VASLVSAILPCIARTPFVMSGVAISQDSVEAVMARPLLELFRGTSSKFHSSGREDLDVRFVGANCTQELDLVSPLSLVPNEAALAADAPVAEGEVGQALAGLPLGLSTGIGRQFVLEICDPHVLAPEVPGGGSVSILATPGEKARLLNHCQQLINGSADATDRVAVHSLAWVPQKFFEVLKYGEKHKVKEYRCVCWVSQAVSVAELDRMCASYANVVVTQRTPLRVSHRRSLLDRKRVVHTMSAEPIFTRPRVAGVEPRTRFFYLNLATQVCLCQFDRACLAQ
jgi:hypothetical protein